MTGIDISGFQPVVVPGDWEFIVIKSTQGTSVSNPKVTAQWAAAAGTRRGLYHYARPGQSDGATQANYFADDALRRGFQPGVDMWQLDAEGQLNETVAPATWRTFIDAFMVRALARLGKAGFLYIGWPFYTQQYGNNHSALQRYNWWLPAYGNNDGGVHPYPPGTPDNLVVIHQYTYAGNLDQNRIADRAKYDSLFAPPPPPPPKDDAMDLASAINADGHPEVFAVEPDGTLSHTWRPIGEGWKDWVPFGPGGAFDAITAFANPVDGHLEVCAHVPGTPLNATLHVWQQQPNGNWTTAWAKLAGP